MGFIYENINTSPFLHVAEDQKSAEFSNNKHVTFGKVETFEFVKIEEKKSVKKKIQGFLDNALTIGNDENLKLLIQNQTF